jgi:hypothetical protein
MPSTIPFVYISDFPSDFLNLSHLNLSSTFRTGVVAASAVAFHPNILAQLSWISDRDHIAVLAALGNSTMSIKLRRVVTGHDATGRAAVKIDTEG